MNDTLQRALDTLPQADPHAEEAALVELRRAGLHPPELLDRLAETWLGEGWDEFETPDAFAELCRTDDAHLHAAAASEAWQARLAGHRELFEARTGSQIEVLRPTLTSRPADEAQWAAHRIAELRLVRGELPRSVNGLKRAARDWWFGGQERVYELAPAVRDAVRLRLWCPQQEAFAALPDPLELADGWVEVSSDHRLVAKPLIVEGRSPEQLGFARRLDNIRYSPLYPLALLRLGRADEGAEALRALLALPSASAPSEATVQRETTELVAIAAHGFVAPLRDALLGAAEHQREAFAPLQRAVAVLACGARDGLDDAALSLIGAILEQRRTLRQLGIVPVVA